MEPAKKPLWQDARLDSEAEFGLALPSGRLPLARREPDGSCTKVIRDLDNGRDGRADARHVAPGAHHLPQRRSVPTLRFGTAMSIAPTSRRTEARRAPLRRRTRAWRLLCVPALTAAIAATLALALVPAAQAADVGFVDGSYGFTSAPTGMKPQSKLWYTSDGIWWGLMYNGFTGQLEIYRRVLSGTN